MIAIGNFTPINYANFPINIFNVGEEPLTADPIVVSATEGKVFSGTVATFTDAAFVPGSAPLLPAASFFSGLINWGDGLVTAVTPADVTVLDGMITVSGTHTYQRYGSYPISLKLDDDGGTNTTIVGTDLFTVSELGGASTTAVGPATVADQKLNLVVSENITPIEGQGFSGAVGSFSDNNPFSSAADFAATIDWGDGSERDAAPVIRSDQGFFDVIGAHTYAEETSGTPYPITVTVTDIAGNDPTLAASVQINSMADVLDAPLESHGVPSIPGEAGVALSVTNLVAPVVATFTDSNPQPDIDDFSADAVSIDWGDGTISNATLITDQGTVSGITYYVQGDHTYDAPGDYQILVTIPDAGGSETVAASEAIISEYTLAAAGATANLPEGVPEDDEPIATIIDTNPNADFTTTPPVVVSENPDITVTNPTVVPVAGSTTAYVVYADLVGDDSESSGSERDGGGLLITITDANANLVAVASSQVNLYDPVLIDPGTAIRAASGSSFQGKVASFSTTDLHATSTDFTAVVDWGDGQSSNGVVVPTGSGRFQVTADHTYAGTGTYSVTTTIRDDEGQSVADTTTASVSPPQVVVPGLTIAPSHRRTFSGALTHFTSPVPATAGEFAVLIDWGDGSTSSGTVVAGKKKVGGTAFTVLGTHHYAHRGRYSGAVTIIEDGAAVASVPVVSVRRPAQSRIASAREPAAGRPREGVPGQLLQTGHPRGPHALPSGGAHGRPGRSRPDVCMTHARMTVISRAGRPQCDEPMGAAPGCLPVERVPCRRRGAIVARGETGRGRRPARGPGPGGPGTSMVVGEGSRTLSGNTKTMRRSGIILISAGLFLSLAAATRVSTDADDDDGPRPARDDLLGVLVPAYFYPSGPGLADWTRLVEAARSIPLEVILNPASGPGKTRDRNYVAVVARLRRSGRGSWPTLTATMAGGRSRRSRRTCGRTARSTRSMATSSTRWPTRRRPSPITARSAV